MGWRLELNLVSRILDRGQIMACENLRDIINSKIELLLEFKRDIQLWFNRSDEIPELRSKISRNARRAKEIIIDAGCMRAITLSPPPSVGGYIVRNADPFSYIFQSYNGMSLIPTIADIIEETIGVLESPEYLERQVNLAQQPEPGLESFAKGMQRVIQVCRRFPLVARQLQQRHSNRPTLTMDDEYDVQDLFRALLKIDFDDVRAEEWTPSYAGKSARLDFLLKREGIVIEIKKTRPTLGTKEVGDQLIIDIERYKAHPDCKCLICFVYDPEFRIGNPAEIEGDLTGGRDRLDVRVLIAPNSA
jgi:hypothetical protein